MVGKRFGRLIVEEQAGKQGAARVWRCQCDCGNEAIVTTSNLNAGRTKSCGCLQRELASERCRSRRKHGLSHTAAYRSWRSMINRCTNPGHFAFKDYGGRGVTVCERWLAFENFYKDMGDKPDGMTLERVDNDQGYSPQNCKWATYSEQNRNRRPAGSGRRRRVVTEMTQSE